MNDALTQEKDTGSATWKFDFADTVQADPLAKGGCLAVIRSYLHFASKTNPKAFCSLSELMLRTGLSKPAVLRAKDTLIRLGYMEALYVTDEGATMYKLVNARKAIIDDHLRIARESMAAEKRDRKRRERRARGGNETIHPEIFVEERNDTPVWNETLPNTVEEHRRGYISEAGDIEVGGRSLRSCPIEIGGKVVPIRRVTENDVDIVTGPPDTDASPYDDLMVPFEIPADDSAAEEVLALFGPNIHPVIRASLRQMLMNGELTPALIGANLGGYHGPA
ncbi:hypothetical protein [Rhizobium binae]|uniref:hypothetical protein n=1 Tax=Rhizobium binae TaxID=1138190 RepID=UPI001C8370DF|nr:hypothetical protein [Rhizobium binae]MBX4940975.1 hypothetical protein [Rhizobium binae]MBX4942380.1 hypothetical protein [Rhizobium binae]MBX4982101.1 hypothetical protein [Rhizobium binae]